MRLIRVLLLSAVIAGAFVLFTSRSNFSLRRFTGNSPLWSGPSAVRGAGFDLAFEAALGAPAGYSPAFFSRTDQYSQARACGRGCRLRSHAILASPAVSGLKVWPCALHIS